MAEVVDFIVFGATGFTGKCTLPYLYKFAKAEGRNFSWGIAGRSEAKLKAVLTETSKQIGVENLDYVPIIIADVDDETSIKKMAERARVIINCCGPYTIYGEVVVKCCVANGTHLVDVSAEMQYIEGMRLKYHKEAEKTGSYIVSACGLDSLPSDMGIVFLENKFEGTLNSVEVFLSGTTDQGKWLSGPAANLGTYHSLIMILANLPQFFSIKKQMNSTPLPVCKPKLSMRLLTPSRNPAKKWIFCPFIIPDRYIMQQSQRYFYEQDKTRRPIQTEMYAGVENVILLILALVLGPVFLLLSQFEMGRNILLKYSSIFTLGYITHENPSVKNIEDTSASYVYYGEGWKEKLTEGSDQYTTPPNRSIVAKMTCKNPGYGFTCYGLCLSALMFLTEKDKLPKKGGVYTTAAAFAKTSLIKQLQNNGAKFEITSVNDI